MADRYHIGRDGQPHKCNAEVGKCPLGGEHYGSMSEARRGAEGQAARHQNKMRYLKKAGSLRKGGNNFIGYLNDFDIRADEVNSLIAAVDTRHTIEFDTNLNGPVVYPLKTMRLRDKGVKQKVDGSRAMFSGVQSRMDSLYESSRGEGLGCAYQSLENLDADYAALSNELRRRAGIPSDNNRTYSDVVYTLPGTHSGIMVNSYMTISEEALKADGIDPEALKMASDTLDMKKVRDFVEGTADRELGIRKGQRGGPAMREEFVKASGLFQQRLDYNPDKKSLTAIANAHPDCVVNRQVDEESIGKMSSGQLRAVTATIGEQRARMNASIISMQQGIDPQAVKASAGKDGDSIQGLRFKTRTTTSLVNSREYVEQWVEQHGGDVNDLKSSRRTLSTDSLKAYVKEHDGDLYKYVVPSHRVLFKDFDADDGNAPKAGRILSEIVK